MKLLVTGFEPFGGEGTNPSWEAVSRLPDEIGPAHIHKLRLPVVFGECGERLRSAAARLRPDAVICCGVANSRTEITPELLAVNWRMGVIPDNSGAHYTGSRIDPAAPDAIMTSLPVLPMVSALKNAGIPARLSLSAGAYVCNDLYFSALQMQADTGCKGLFIHVPPTSALPLEETIRALTLCLSTLLDPAE